MTRVKIEFYSDSNALTLDGNPENFDPKWCPDHITHITIKFACTFSSWGVIAKCKPVRLPNFIKSVSLYNYNGDLTDWDFPESVTRLALFGTKDLIFIPTNIKSLVLYNNCDIGKIKYDHLDELTVEEWRYRIDLSSIDINLIDKLVLKGRSNFMINIPFAEGKVFIDNLSFRDGDRDAAFPNGPVESRSTYPNINFAEPMTKGAIHG